MQYPADLRDVQALFWKLITAPEGVAPGARSLAEAGELPSPDVSFLVSDDGKLSSSERLDIYADMYFYRLHDCLLEDYPRLAAHLGKARFHNLVTAYLVVHPPSHYSLRELGRALPGFLQGQLQAQLEGHLEGQLEGQSTTPLGTLDLAGSLPAAADLARLEWARVDVFDEADAAPISLDALLDGATHEPERYRVELVPGARVLELAPRALELWREEQEAGVDEAEQTGTAHVRVWRKGFQVYHSRMTGDETAAMKRLSAGPSGIAELAECVVEAGPRVASSEQASQRLAALLAAWTRDELLTAPRPP
jgi:hypothetical protein